jgi:arylsulfatase A-like enzyme
MRFELPGNLNNHKDSYSTDLFTEEALSFLDRHQHEPFFLYLPYTLPHANNELGRKTGNGMEVPSDQPYGDRDWPQPQKNHAAMITRLDRDIGRVLERLKLLGLEENTVVFFSSDNGPHAEGGADPKFFRSAGPLRGHKRDLYDGGIRVPMIVRWPGRVPAGAVSEQVWAFWDMLPTCAEIARVESPKGIDGVSVLPALLGQSEVPRDFLYWEYPERGFQQAVRMGDWKAVRPVYGQPLELYNLRHDISEEHNVASEHPDVISRIEEYLKTARIASERWPLPRQTGGGL